MKLGDEPLSEMFPHHGHAGRDFVRFGKTQTFKPLPTRWVNAEEEAAKGSSEQGSCGPPPPPPPGCVMETLA